MVASTGTGGAAEAARTRAAVTKALFAGGNPSAAPSATRKELLLSGGGLGVMDGGGGAGCGGGVAAMPAKHISPRPAPQRNFKLKVCVCGWVRFVCVFLLCFAFVEKKIFSPVFFFFFLPRDDGMCGFVFGFLLSTKGIQRERYKRSVGIRYQVW